MKWYIAKCPSGVEERCILSLREVMKKMGIDDCLGEYFVSPRKKVASDSIGARRIAPANYIFIQLNFDQKVMQAFKTVEIMSLMLNENLHPQSISQSEMDAMLGKVESEDKEEKLEFSIGEKVSILEEPFAGFSGTIEEINEKSQSAKVLVPILGRPLSLELQFKSIKRITDWEGI